MISSSNLAEVILSEEKDDDFEKKKNIIKEYESLDEKCDKILKKIKTRKSSKNGKKI